MKRLSLSVAILLIIAVPTHAQNKKPELALCPGPFALCAASTCKFTGRQFPNSPFREVVCECPVLKGPSLADLNGGNMQGTCAPPVDPSTKKVGVWSLYSTVTPIPQKVNGVWTKNVAPTPQNCASTAGNPPKPVYYGQCFSYSCKNVHTVNGVVIADCYCPAESVADPNKKVFATQAGQCNQSVCSQMPVGGPFVLPKSFCPTP